MWRRSYNEDWERKKSYLIRSLFHDVPLLSPVPEGSNDSSDGPPRPLSPIAYRPYSPLPPLIIEREPNRHDEPEEYYRKLAVKIRKIYKKMFIEGRDLSDSDLIDDLEADDYNIDEKNDSIDSNHITVNGYSADYESYESQVPYAAIERNENNNNIENDESNDSSDVDNDTDENNNSRTRSDGTDSALHEEYREMEKEIIDLNIHEELAQEVASENTEDKSGSDYRQVTTEAQVHVDGTEVDSQSCVYEGSVRSVILTSRWLRRVEAGREQDSERSEGEQSEESMADKETVILEDNEDPEDIDMAHSEPVEESEAEVSNIEVMRTPQPKISADSVAHVTHRQSDISTEYNVTHHASLMTSKSDASKSMSPNFNVSFLNEASKTVDRGRSMTAKEIIFDTEVASYASPILNVTSLKYVNRDREINEEVFESDMDITSPVSRLNVSFIKTVEYRDSGSNFGEISSEPHVRAAGPPLGVESLIEENEERFDECRKRKSNEITSITEVLRREASLNEDAIVNVDRGSDDVTGIFNLNEDRCRKRRGEDVSVQTVAARAGWGELRGNFFVGAPKIYKLCHCSDHVCN